MKTTKAKLKQLIKEELQVVLTNEEVEEMFGEDVRAQVEESEQFRAQQQMDDTQPVAKQQMSFEEWITVVFQKGAQIDDKSPNSYDAWLSGQSPEEYATATKIAKENNMNNNSYEMEEIEFSVAHVATLDTLERLGFNPKSITKNPANGQYRIALEPEEATKFRDIAQKSSGTMRIHEAKNKKMKIKKSELLALIKEEIMGEMDGLTMMDDPYDDAAVPDTMQRGGAMDQVAQEMEQMITVEMDDVVSIISNYLVTQDSAGDPQKAAIRGMAMLRDAGFRAPDPSTIEQMISPEMRDEEPMMQEGFENITPENMQLVVDALQKLLFSPYTGPMIAAAFAAVGVQSVREMFGKRGGDE